MEKLKLILEGIWKFINSKFFTIAVIVLLLMIGAGECKRILDLKRQGKLDEQNQAALVDSIKAEKKKNGDLIFSKDGFISSIKNLKHLNDSLYDKIKHQGGNIISLTHAIIKLRQDSIDLANSVDKLKVYIGELERVDTNHWQCTWVLPYKYDNNNFFSVNGTTRIGVLHQNPLYLVHDTTYLTGFTNQIDLQYGEEMVKDKYRVYIKSSFPGFTVQSLEGWTIDPATNPLFKKYYEKKHWFTGWGMGPGINAGWNILEAKPAINVGISFHYTIYEW